MLREPSDYHYNTMIDGKKAGKDINDFINNIYTNPNYKTKEELLHFANESINELKERETAMQEYKKKSNVFIIKVAEFIEQNFQLELLFWTVNHPTKYVFQYLAFEILNLLNSILPSKISLMTISKSFASFEPSTCFVWLR